MARFKIKKRKGSKANLGVIVTTIIFLIIGIILLIVGYGNEFLNWLKTFGVVILVISLPILVTCLGIIINNKIKEL